MKTQEVYEFGTYRLDVGEHRFERTDGIVNGALSEKAFQTLVVLLRNQGRLITKSELFDAVWSDTSVEENNLSKAIHSIRQVLHEKPGEQKYIETIPKHGYRFVAEVVQVSGATNTDDLGASRTVSAELDATRNPLGSPAFDLYVRGKVKAGSENPLDTENAIKVLEAAIAIDPFFAPAYAQLARAYNTRAFKFSSGPQRKLLHENADVAVEKALSFDPNLAEGHFARGLILWTNTKGFPHKQAIRAFKRALELDPDSDEAHHQLSMVFSHVGLLEEGHREVNKALEINPNNTMARFRVGVYYGYQGEFDQALRVFKTIPTDVSPMLVDRCKAEVLVQMGCLSEAEEIVERYLCNFPTDEGGSFTSVKAVLLAKAGNRKGAETAAAQAAEIGRDYGHFHHTAHNIASTHAALNEPEEAVKWLENAADTGFPNYAYFAIDPNLDPIRRDRRFVEFMKGLELQWRQFKELA